MPDFKSKKSPSNTNQTNAQGAPRQTSKLEITSPQSSTEFPSQIGGRLSPDLVMRLQRTIGNRDTGRLLSVQRIPTEKPNVVQREVVNMALHASGNKYIGPQGDTYYIVHRVPSSTKIYLFTRANQSGAIYDTNTSDLRRENEWTQEEVQYFEANVADDLENIEDLANDEARPEDTPRPRPIPDNGLLIVGSGRAYRGNIDGEWTIDISNADRPDLVADFSGDLPSVLNNKFAGVYFERIPRSVVEKRSTIRNTFNVLKKDGRVRIETAGNLEPIAELLRKNGFKDVAVAADGVSGTRK